MSKRHTGGLSDVLWLSLVLTFDSHLSCYSSGLSSSEQLADRQPLYSGPHIKAHPGPLMMENSPALGILWGKMKHTHKNWKIRVHHKYGHKRGGKLLKRNRRHKPDWNVMGKKKLWSVFIYFFGHPNKTYCFQFPGYIMDRRWRDTLLHLLDDWFLSDL